MKKLLTLTTALGLLLWPANYAMAQQGGTVEVLHWWTSGGEAAALDILKNNLEKQGITWVDMPVSGGGGSEAMTVLRARVTSGNPPTSVQMLGFDVRDWAEQGALANLDGLAASENWDTVIPTALQEFAKYDGHWVAAPLTLHSTNWMWINKAALDKAGGKIPQNWDELIAMLDNFKSQGIIPIAIGGNPWQESVLFDGVVASFGADFYKKTMIDLDEEALGSETMRQAFERMAKLKTYVDSNFSGRDWNLASAMVIEGQAGVQFMGDWAKGEFVNAGKKPEVDFVCARFPQTEGIVTFNADMFAMFKVSSDREAAQLAMAKAVEDPAFQASFNVVKGAAAARTDVSNADFDYCGKKAISDVVQADEAGTLLGSMSNNYANPTAVRNAMYDVVTRHFNEDINTEEAVSELVSAVAAAK